ncbi:hypothetical protein FB566_2387 [Stackebrandtia endophytica]|uniref:Uncharacterized protein n=1 Tax=Stackebrandtia endophytica TaxID=1496996 RepID=A0A543AW78_9ACTN|nr:WD40 repeat domain-containing protein [Stackebrandtia endophytica]TQL76845.1 hypothetical protein FB566_2387 [Stackebrandtia endophytica]
MTARRTLTIMGVAGLMVLGACSADSNASGNEPDARETQAADTPVRGGGGIQDFPSYSDVDATKLAEPAADEAWSFDMASGSAMAVAELDGASVLLSATRRGDVEIYDLATGEPVQTHSVHDNAIRALHPVEVDGQPLVVSVEVGLATVWNLTTGESVTDIDLGSDYDFTAVIEYNGSPTFVNGGKEIVLTDLSTMQTAEHYRHQLGLSSHHGNIVTIDGATVLVADNVVGGEYGVGAWNLEDGSTMYSYPMYEHADRSINRMASGYLGDTVLTVSGDHGGDLRAWDVTANQEYGPAVNLDGSSITALAVVQLDGTLVGIAATLDRTIAMWNVETGEIIEQFDSPGLGVTHLVVTDIDGRPAVVAGGDSWAMPYRLG